jgi:hypothetical protein
MHVFSKISSTYLTLECEQGDFHVIKCVYIIVILVTCAILTQFIPYFILCMKVSVQR